MFVREIGSAGPGILLLHGAPSPSADLMPLAQRLAERHRVLIPDLPGYGATPAGDPSYGAVNLQLVAMLAERGLTSLHGLVGFSGGVLRCLYLMLRGKVPTNVLVSIGGLAGLDQAGRDAFRGFAAMIRADPTTVTAPAMMALMSERMLSAAWRQAHPEDVERVGRWLQLTSPSYMADEIEAVSASEDFGPELGSVRARVYARVGELDVACPVESSEALARGVPDGRVEVVPGCGHALLIEDADATIRAVEAALA